jgi:hypothetical protein
MSGLSDSPDAIGLLIDTLEAEGGEGTSETPPNPDGGNQDGKKPAEDGSQNQNPEGDGTTEQKPVEGEAKPEAAQKQSPYPKALEPFKATLEAKKWDPTKPDWYVEPLKALQEAEQLNGRQSTDLGLTRARVSEVVAALHGSPKEINDLRARAGLPALPFDASSLDDKLKSAEEEWQLLEKALSDDEKASREATAQMANSLRKRIDNLRLEKAVAERTAGKPAGDADANATKKDNYNRLREQFPDATQKLNALVPFLATKYGTGILGSFGMDPYSILTTPERARQAYDLASRLWLGDPENFQSEVKKSVQAEMEKLRKAGNAGAITGGGPAAKPPAKTEATEVEAHLGGMFNKRGSEDD